MTRDTQAAEVLSALYEARAGDVVSFTLKEGTDDFHSWHNRMPPRTVIVGTVIYAGRISLKAIPWVRVQSDVKPDEYFDMYATSVTLQ